MRTILEKILTRTLRFMAKTVLWKYQPKVIAITGSIGKSSTKEAIALVLEPHFRVRKNEGNYNNEIGLPLTILGMKSGGRSIFAWMGIFFGWVGLLLLPKKYPEILVLEMGIDSIGDMDYLISIVQPDIAVATNVSGSHLSQFGSIKNIFREKRKLIKALSDKTGVAILCADNEYTMKMGESTEAKVVTFGFKETADIHIDNLLFHGDVKNVEGYSFKLNYSGKSVPVRLPLVLAKHLIPSALAAAGVGVTLKLNLVEIAQSLEGFKSLPGRMNMFLGTLDTRIIDDTYNASVASTTAALATLAEMQAPRKVVILGDMLELGEESDLHHAGLAGVIRRANVSLVLLVGNHMRALFDELLKSGYQRKQLAWYQEPKSALLDLSSQLRPQDLILVKGSQGMRMEYIVEALMAQSELADSLLCRQNSVWKKTPFMPPKEW